MRGVLLAALVAWLAQDSGVKLEDRIDLVAVDRKILAVGSAGLLLEEDLELGEVVLATESRGLIGVATTSTRLLGVSPGSTSFHELRYRIRERQAPPARIYLGDRVALVALHARLAGLGPESSSWNELILTPGESLLRVAVEANLVGAVTTRRAIAFAPGSGGFVERRLGPREKVERISIEPSSLVLTTSNKVLVFRTGAAIWIERTRSIR